MDEEIQTIILQHVKHDWYEKGLDVLNLYMYVKNINKETLEVAFEETKLTVKFQARDPSFLRHQDIVNEDALFLWELNLKEHIIPDECQFKLNANKLTVVFKKKLPRRWGVLEAPVEGNSSSDTQINTWVPLSKGNIKKLESSLPLQTRNLNEIGLDTTSVSSNSSSSLVNASGENSSFEPQKKIHVVEHVNKIKDLGKKPTCMVHPLSKSKIAEQAVLPGFTGLDNLGNTCFMNSVIQCLANTRDFRDYFLDGYFECEINEENPLGMKGKLAVIFASLLKGLWSGAYHSHSPSKLKTLISYKASQFTGYAQHDAQELMTFLLDGLHEDLNRIKNKPLTQIIDFDGRLDVEVAEESWNLYKQRNDSIVVDLFQGQYKSKLVCPVCEEVSITFDPLFYLSVPLPKKQIYISVYFFSKDPCCKPVKYIISVAHDATVKELKEKISLKTRVQQKNLRVFEVFKNKVHKFFEDGYFLSSVTLNDTIFVFEVLDASIAGETVFELCVIQRIIVPRPVIKCSYCCSESPGGMKLRRCSKCYRAGYCDQNCQRNHWPTHKLQCKKIIEMVGSPFILSIAKSQATFSKLCWMMEAFSRHTVDVFQPPVNISDLHGGILSSSRRHHHDPLAFEEGNDNLPKESFNIVRQYDVENNYIGRTSALGSPTYSMGDHEDLTPRSKEKLYSQKKHCDDALTLGYQCNMPSSFTSDRDDLKSSGNHVPTPPVRAVFGQQHDKQLEAAPSLFYITALKLRGQNAFLSDVVHLEDKGNTPLDLSSYDRMAIDWKNNDKLKNYVLVESKELECDYEDIYSVGPEGKEVTLEQCLRLFTEPEVLSPQEAWYCPQCKEHREATKELSLWRVPPVLIIQLKRFSFKHILLRDKIDCMVEFPIRNLNLGPYYCGPDSLPPPVYDLYAVINHHGGILGGHYTSYARYVDMNNSCRSEIDWRLFDDSRVTAIPESQVVSKEAYILFYRKRSIVFNIPLQKLKGPCCPDSLENEDSASDIEVDYTINADNEMESTCEVNASNIHGTLDNCDNNCSFSPLKMID